jgi:hypothetical protein
MTSFIVDLWESIFTPGPTPTILKAANITFAALQVVLFGLLVGTYSIHFVVLSVLCGGLWWSINWFAAELAIAQERERRDKAAADAAASEGTEDDDTEVEGAGAAADDEGSRIIPEGGTLPVEPLEVKGELKHRVDAHGTQSSVSTEDEWEKVSEDSEKEKTK